ncbi:hypothetical protein [Methylophaga sp.]|jgi:hypothetical protein|uniref:hypothetical protein n=1 Tax=Methylophaga sp. TaxID=2024840 RepID=UPI0013FFB3AF|nr:hypothetical protein [Methylophaga sp.]MTI63968.1 hypothetical protein [Methylophaga sp.]
MKILVNLFQVVIVLAILYPVFYVWDTGRIEDFCELIEPGISVSDLQQLADEQGITLNIPADNDTGQWMTSVESTASIDRFACVVIGAVDRVASARLVTE